MEINTKILKEIVNKSIKCTSNNRILPITSLMGIELVDRQIILTTTDGVTTLRVFADVDNAESADVFYTVVNADMFTKLVNKTTCEYIKLENKENYLEFTGNGTYKLEITLNESGDKIKIPYKDIQTTIVNKVIELNELKEAINITKSSTSKDFDRPSLTGFYFGDKVITTNAYLLSVVQKSLVDTPILIPYNVAELILSMSGTSVDLVQDESQHLVFKSDDMQIYSTQLDGTPAFPVSMTDDIISSSFPEKAILNKIALLNVLDRMLLFVTDYDKNGVFLTFSENGAIITSQKSNATETIEIKDNELTSEFKCLININYLKTQVENIKGEYVTIYFGSKKLIKLEEDKNIFVIALIEPSTN